MPKRVDTDGCRRELSSAESVGFRRLFVVEHSSFEASVDVGGVRSMTRILHIGVQKTRTAMFPIRVVGPRCCYAPVRCLCCFHMQPLYLPNHTSAPSVRPGSLFKERTDKNRNRINEAKSNASVPGTTPQTFSFSSCNVAGTTPDVGVEVDVHEERSFSDLPALTRSLSLPCFANHEKYQNI